jgi:hypothetical protein
MKSTIELLVLVLRAILNDRKTRRQWMFYATLGVLIFIFGGLTPGLAWWKGHPILFAIYVLMGLGGAIWLMLFALYDLLKVRQEYQRELNQLKTAPQD